MSIDRLDDPPDRRMNSLDASILHGSLKVADRNALERARGMPEFGHGVRQTHRDTINVHTGTVRATRSGRDVELRTPRTKSFKIIALTDCETRSISGLAGCGLARTQRRHFMQAWNNSERNSYFSYFSSTGINAASRSQHVTSSLIVIVRVPQVLRFYLISFSGTSLRK